MQKRDFYCFFIFFLIFAAKGLLAADYNVIDRYSLLEDRLKTDEMLRPYGHDFIIDNNAAVTDGLNDFVDEVKVLSDATDSVAAAKIFLTARKDTEVGFRAHVELGAPLFSFTAWGVKIVPDFRLGANMGAHLGVKTAPLTAATVLDIFGDSVPAALGDIIVNRFDTYNAGDDLFTEADCTTAGIPTGAGTPCQTFLDKNLKFPDVSLGLPDLFVFSKLDVKAGFLFNYYKNNWFGYFNLYGLHRSDFLLRQNEQSFRSKSDPLDGADELNSQISLNIDYKLGYRFGRYRVFALVEELKVTTMSDKITERGDLNFGNDALLRFHGDTLFKFAAFSLTPFVGAHKRSHYDLSDGIYGGADFGMAFWGDRLGLRLRTMLDPEHITISPQFKLWVMQLEYALKTPITSTLDDGTKVSKYHSLNFRMFF